jgi:hypothetical protein
MLDPKDRQCWSKTACQWIARKVAEAIALAGLGGDGSLCFLAFRSFDYFICHSITILIDLLHFPVNDLLKLQQRIALLGEVALAADDELLKLANVNARERDAASGFLCTADSTLLALEATH